MRAALRNRWKFILPVLALLLIMAGSASAAVFNLRTGTTTKTMPGTGENVTMWGFALVSYDIGAGVVPGDDVVRVPGPALTMPTGDTTLTVNLTNNLPVPISLVIPGQRIVPTPTYAGGRVMSFTAEAPASGGTASYTWNSLKAGTYLYLSGTNPAVQVQMGLYGEVRNDAAAGQAYAGIPYDSQVTLLYSEIDPALHTAVAGGTYGTPAYPSTVNYHPKYFLVNGEPYSTAAPPLAAGSANGRTLVRFLNAGLETHVPTMLGSNVSAIAQDGNLYPHPARSYALTLPAGKTVDAIFTPTAAGTFPVFDRALNLTNAAMPAGGMLAYLTVAAVSGAPVATGDSYPAAEDTALSVAAPGVLGNDSDPDGDPLTAVLVSGPTSGTLALNADGSFTYTPNANFNGTDIFTYKASDGTLDSNVATVQITVTPANDPPVTADDAYTATATVPLTVPMPGLLANDADMDGDMLMAIIVTPPAGNLALNMDGSFTYTYPTSIVASVIDTFTYKANDGTVDGNTATVTITVNPRVNQPPVAANDSATTTKNVPVTINVIANDSDPDGTINPATVIIVTKPRKGTAAPQPNGTVIYTPNLNFKGTDPFTYTVKDNEGATSNTATVRVNVLK